MSDNSSKTLNVGNIQLLYKTLQKNKFDTNFGICNLSIGKGDPLWGVLHFVFNLDRSGSMGSLGADGKTAWENIVHTMRCILDYCNQSKVQVFISIILFDHEIVELYTSKLLTEENVKSLSDTLGDSKKFYPRGSTDIAKAMVNHMKHFICL